MQPKSPENIEIKNPEELISKLKARSETNLAQRVESVIEGIGLTTEQKWKKLKEGLNLQESQMIVEIFEKEDPKIKEKLINTRLDNLAQKVDSKTQSGNLSQTQKTPEVAKTPIVKTSSNIIENPLDWAKEHPLAATGIGLGTAFIGYKAISWIFGDSSKSSDKSSDSKEGMIDSLLDKAGIKGDYAKWAKNFGVFGLIAALGVGLFMGKDKAGELFTKVKDFFGFESKEIKTAYEVFAKNVSDSEKKEVKPATVKKIKGEKVKDFISDSSKIGGLVQTLISKGLGFAGLKEGAKLLGLEEKELEEVKIVRDYLKKKIDNKEITIKDDTTIEDIVKGLSGNPELAKDTQQKVALVSAGAATSTVVPGQEKPKEDQSTGNLDKDPAKNVEEAKKWPGMEMLLGAKATGEDRILASRVLEYSAKSYYYNSLYNSYLKHNGYDVGARIEGKLDSIYRESSRLGHGNYTGSLARMIEVENKGGLQKLLSDLQGSKNKDEIVRIKKEIDAYLLNVKNFEKEFGMFVRNAKHKDSILNEKHLEIAEFEALKTQEKILGENLHEVSQKFDNEITELRKTEKDPKILATKEAELRKKYSESLHGIDGKGGMVGELREVQKKMLNNVEIISKHGSKEAQEFIHNNKNRIVEKVLPGGKLGLALIGITVGSVAINGIKDKEKLAYMGAEMVGAFIPGVNVGLDARQILYGTDLAGGKLAGWERWGLAPAFLVLDTLGSIASLTGVGYAGQAMISGAKVAIRGGKIVKGASEVKGAVKVADAAHAAEGITKETKLLEELKNMGANISGGIKDFRNVPSDFLLKYREGMQAAHNSGFLKLASPLATVSKIAVYGGIGYSLYTGVGEIGSFVKEKTNNLISSFSGGKADNYEKKAA